MKKYKTIKRDGIARLNINCVKESVGCLKKEIPQKVKTVFGSGELQDEAGVYAFWWMGSVDALKERIKKGYKLKGPYINKCENFVYVAFDEAWLNVSEFEDRICLYVGKSTKLRQRERNHLKLTTKNIWIDSKGKLKTKEEFSFEKKPNTDSQLRIGLERLFQKHALEEIKKYVAISWISIAGKEHAVNRFFIEDKMIAELLPLFNIDVER